VIGEVLVFGAFVAGFVVVGVWVGIIVARRLDRRLARGDGESDDGDRGSDD
jgi:hypothetical protein